MKSSSRLINFFIFLLFLIWLILQIAIPLSLPRGSVELPGDEERYLVYEIGDKLCHQKSDRSYFINGNQLPFCARCTGIWIGMAIGTAITIFRRIELDGKFAVFIVVSLFPLAIDGTGQLLGFWESINIIRMITGILAGTACGIAIGVIVYEIGDIRKTI